MDGKTGQPKRQPSLECWEPSPEPRAEEAPLSGLIAGGANEYAIGYLKKTKGKDWTNKHPDTVQNISAAFGGILSKMAGGGRHTGAYLSRMGNALGGANGFYLYYEDNIPDDVKNILLIQQLS